MELFDYNLTTLSMPGREMGWQAAERILETMQGTKQEAVQETHINWSF
jgi:DNA-binding LacI/PurR family transcriptional regulator